MKSKLESYPYNTNELQMAYGLVNNMMLISITHEKGSFKLNAPVQMIKLKLPSLKISEWHVAKTDRRDIESLESDLRFFLDTQKIQPQQIIFVGDANLGASNHDELSPLINEILKALLVTNIPITKFLYSNDSDQTLENLREDAFMHDTRAHRTYVSSVHEAAIGAVYLIEKGTMQGYNKLPASQYDSVHRSIPNETSDQFKEFKNLHLNQEKEDKEPGPKP